MLPPYEVAVSCACVLGSLKNFSPRSCKTCSANISYYFLKYILLIMLLQLSHYFPTSFPCALHHPSHHHFPTLSSCPWVMHISSLASPFLPLFLTSPCLFCSYQLCFLIPAAFLYFPPSLSQLITLQMISILMILFLFCLFASSLKFIT